MVTRTIPREEWADYFDELSEMDEASQVTVESLGLDTGDQVVARDLRLQGITLEEKGSGQGRIDILLGDDPATHISHTITTPTRVAIQEDEDGEPLALQIEGEGEPTTLVHFRAFADTSLLEEGDEEDE